MLIEFAGKDDMDKIGKLKVIAANEREIEVTRTFEAPRKLVFDCWTKPELLKMWMKGPDDWAFATCKVDLRIRGKFHFVWRNVDGVEVGIGGVYKEVIVPERIVNTELLDADKTGRESISTLVLVENAGKTSLKNTVIYPSKEIRDTTLNSKLEAGLAIGYDRLEQVLKQLMKK